MLVEIFNLRSRPHEASHLALGCFDGILFCTTKSARARPLTLDSMAHLINRPRDFGLGRSSVVGSGPIEIRPYQASAVRSSPRADSRLPRSAGIL
ncbi:hypothetical protein Nepgr_010314 [Nepenthes gracilis]|uniref:Uncharacterized protein n=1 Tax=Nepenthes gracilis TaxID=150966 RepID=A0AAD3XL73_NEPGR|nr:hypothetical protein Nepgr_010314 [Nepenthes gracilis]